jgi:hypothetical protein
MAGSPDSGNGTTTGSALHQLWRDDPMQWADDGPDCAGGDLVPIVQTGGQDGAPGVLASQSQLAAHQPSIRRQHDLVGIRMRDRPADDVLGR